MKKYPLMIGIIAVILISITACAGLSGTSTEQSAAASGKVTSSNEATAPKGTGSGAATVDKPAAQEPTPDGASPAPATTTDKPSSTADKPSTESKAAGERSSDAAKKEGFMPEFVEDSGGSSKTAGGSSKTAGGSSETAGASPKTAGTATSSAGKPQASASGLKAGFADDNQQYGYFVKFLKEYESTPHLTLAVEERIKIQVTDKDGKSIPNADVSISADGKVYARGKTHADGGFLFFPSEYAPAQSRSGDTQYSLSVTVNNQTKNTVFTRNGKREVLVTFNTARNIKSPLALDIVFIMDTTGSMGDEIERLKTTIELIHLNLVSLKTKPEVRFGMVLYKDMEDEYRTQTIPLTGDLPAFQEELDQVYASGGGDTPEDLQAALEVTMRNMDWNPSAIKLSFIITDAPPHLDYGQEYDYTAASRDAKTKAVKFFSVGTGGLPLSGEYVLRQISQYTSGKYIFLTYGETDESEGGAPGSVSHHTGANFQTDKLESIIIRFAKEELSYLTDEPLEDAESYFEASKITDETREDTLKKLFTMSVTQLIDFSTINISRATTAAILPMVPADASTARDAEYFTEQLIFTGASMNLFTMVERKDLQKLMAELKLQLSGVTDETNAADIGKFLNAELLISGTLYKKASGYELFLKLVRVESAEVLSVTKAVLANDLGLTLGDN